MFSFRPGQISAKKHAVTCVVVILLSVHALLLAWGARVHSPTLNEPGHLVAGISIWKYGRFDIYRVNPPLVRLVATVPVLLAGCKTEWRSFYNGPDARPEFALGEDFVAANQQRSAWLFTLARWACIPFSLIGGFVCFRWARDLYGSPSGLLALFLWCFCPNILAHGQLITSDVAGTSLGFAAFYAFWHYLKRPSWQRCVTAGCLLGIAELTKLTWIMLLILWPIIWICYRWPDRYKLAFRSWMTGAAELLTIVLLSLNIVNLGYAEDGVFTRLGDFHFVSEAFSGKTESDSPRSAGNRFSSTWLAGLLVPLPQDYLLGIDRQLSDFEGHSEPSYLNGQFSSRGWWYYYLYALAIKVPVGTLLLLCLALYMQISSRKLRRDEFVLLFPAASILLLASSQIGLNNHMRYVLAIFPFLYVWISQVAVAFENKRIIMSGFVAASLCWIIASSLSIFPHSLSYFNELVGGPKGGPAHLLYSNADWGQDLLFLRKWMTEHPEARPIHLAYFGYFDPRDLGVEYVLPELDPKDDNRTARIQPGWYALSVNFVQGYPWTVYKTREIKRYFAQNSFAEFQKLKPIAMAGYSIYIYYIPQSN